jgi:hypothetical protein
MAHDRVQWRALVLAVLNLGVVLQELVDPYCCSLSS